MTVHEFKVIKDVEIREGEPVMKCDGCGCVGHIGDVSSMVVSCLHEHHSANSFQKRIKTRIKFENTEGQSVFLCHVCQARAVQSAAKGAMFR